MRGDRADTCSPPVTLQDAARELMTLAEVAEHLRVSRSTVARWRAEGRLRCTSPAGSSRVLVRRTEVERLLTEGEATQRVR